MKFPFIPHGNLPHLTCFHDSLHVRLLTYQTFLNLLSYCSKYRIQLILFKYFVRFKNGYKIPKKNPEKDPTPTQNIYFVTNFCFSSILFIAIDISHHSSYSCFPFISCILKWLHRHCHTVFLYFLSLFRINLTGFCKQFHIYAICICQLPYHHTLKQIQFVLGYFRYMGTKMGFREHIK